MNTLIDPRVASDAPQPLDLPQAASPSETAPTLSSLKKRPGRANGNVARLPQTIRDSINAMIQDGLTYRAILENLGNQAKGLSRSDLSQWRKRRYRDWLAEQSFLQRIRGRQETPADIVRDFDSTGQSCGAAVGHAAHTLFSSPCACVILPPAPMTANSPEPPPGSEAWFTTTHWSIVVSAQEKDSPRSAAALETLCRTYWYPLYAFLRRQGRSPHDAQDLTQGFFARLLEKDYLHAAARERGKFRTFLLVALKRFLANEWDREHALKRGGFAPVVSIDQELAESRFAAEPAHHDQPDVLFDRQWAMTLLERAMTRLQEEYVSSGRAKLFEYLQSCLGREESALPYAEIAARLKLSEPAVRMAVHRLRARYREILRAEIAHTVSSTEEIEEEVRHLFSAFGP